MKRISTLITQMGAMGAALLFSLSAQAAEEITARFRPDASNPMLNRFENTTPISSICAAHIPARCKALGIFSLRDTDFRLNSNARIMANHEDERKGFMVKVPSDWRDLQVTHTVTGETETVQLRIAGIGSLWTVPRPPGVSAWAQPGFSWQSRWTSAPTPCQSTGHLAAGVNFASYFWLTPENAGPCSRQPSQDLAFMSFNTMEYAYELRTPNPLGMSSGQYVGGITYSIGPGADYDFGDVIVPSKNAITFNFTLSVEHALKVDIPPGGNRIELLPDGGWQAWLDRGRTPTRLYRDQTFRIAASSRFKMQLECSIVMGNTCGLRNGNGDEVPVQVAVTLPGGIDGQGDQAVRKRPLRLDGTGTELFQPLFYVNDRPGTLHFEVLSDDMRGMLDQPGSTYSGVVTVVWDSEV
ncbi:hypothetical protein [Pseudomonas sp. TAE6080]|uniref:hypothetical protein n=1 Tax=Pseudomonas sp. TAE6080 TaxID=2840374 RepID=UPI001C001B81|nr:hypothetical protein [Pseudomonas sp. TAE6080]MBT9299699.1 hypothetical protein [Pseudomonas sp. TAE6080]